jgi:hypothetical protein
MPEDQWNIRIQAARDAQTRSRLSFLASTVISVAMLIAIFNFEFSWLRNVAVSDDPKHRIRFRPSGAAQRSQEGVGLKVDELGFLCLA